MISLINYLIESIFVINLIGIMVNNNLVWVNYLFNLIKYGKIIKN